MYILKFFISKTPYAPVENWPSFLFDCGVRFLLFISVNRLSPVHFSKSVSQPAFIRIRITSYSFFGICEMHSNFSDLQSEKYLACVGLFHRSSEKPGFVPDRSEEHK